MSRALYGSSQHGASAQNPMTRRVAGVAGVWSEGAQGRGLPQGWPPAALQLHGLAQQQSAPQSFRGSGLCQGARSVLHLGGEGASQQVPGWLLGSAWTLAPMAPTLLRVIPGAGCLMPGAVLMEGREAQVWHARVPAALMGQQVGGSGPEV